MDNQEQILDEDIKDWVNEQDYKVNLNSCSKLAEDISISTANELVSSVVRKIGILEGVRKANEILKNLDIDTEIDLTTLTKEINEINELELKLLALRTCNISKDSKQKILNKYIEKFGSQENKKQETIVDLLRNEINKIYRTSAELPSSNIDEVRMVRDEKPLATRPSKKPFGRKNK